MILSPVKGDFRISQGFGENPEWYKPFGLKGHDGQDIATPVGTPIYSPIDGIGKYFDTGSKGYGKYIVITEDKKGECRQILLAHLSKFDTTNLKLLGDNKWNIKAGQLIGFSGNTGNSTGAHLHWSICRLLDGKVLNFNNGYKGKEDIFEKGWILKNLSSKY